MTATTGETAGTTRCIYTGDVMVNGDARLRPSHEHVVPLSLGGSNGLTTDDVAAYANARAGQEIDDAVASQLPFLMLRQRYGLKGNRRTVPDVVFEGMFTDLNDAPARMAINADAEISFALQREQTVSGTAPAGTEVVTFATTEERLRFLLLSRLEQTRRRKVQLHTPYGQITDEEDVEIALLLPTRREGKEFKARAKIDIGAFGFSYSRLMIKIGLALGHRVLGPFWTFGGHGDRLRQELWAKPTDTPSARRWGSIYPGPEHPLGQFLGIEEDHHVMAVLPSGTATTVAIIGLFGGAFGVATVDLGGNHQRLFETGGDAITGGCVFKIPLDADVKNRRVQRRLFRHLAEDAAAMGFNVASSARPVSTRARR